MKQRWMLWRQQFFDLPSERRVLIAIAIWVLVTVPLLSYAVVPLITAKDKATQNMAQLQQQIATAESLVAQQREMLTADINQPVANEIARKRRQLERLEQVSDGLSLFDKEQRQAFLQSALAYPDSVKLLSLDSEQPKRLSDDDNVALFQHSVVAVYQGNFDDLKPFFEQLTDDYKALSWYRFDYQVTAYPAAEVTVTWHLMSSDKEIIGG